MRIDHRLSAIEDLTISGLALADVGTDHAKLPLDLLEKGRIPKALGTDISQNVIDKIKGLETENLKLRCSPGLDGISPVEYPQLVIAGMGGELIARILVENLDKAKLFKKIILQPMSRARVLRDFLAENGFNITREILTQADQKFYEIFSVEAGKMEFSYMENEIGFKKARKIDRIYQEFIEQKIENYQKKIDNMSLSKDPEVVRKRAEYEKRLKFLREYAKAIKTDQSN